MVSLPTDSSCHRFRANAFRLLLHSFAYNLVNLFRLQLPASLRSAQIETLRTQLFKIGARIRRNSSLHPCPPGQRLALSGSLFQTVALALQLFIARLGSFDNWFTLRSARRSYLEKRLA